MLYQETFQSGENPSEIRVSSCVYRNGLSPAGRGGVSIGFPMHCHSFFELAYTFEGSGEAEVGGRRIETLPRTLYFVPPLAVHGSAGHTESRNMVLQFTHKFLEECSSSFRGTSTLIPAGRMLRDGYITPEPGGAVENCLQKIAAISPVFVTPISEDKRKIDYSLPYEWELNGLTLLLITRLLALGDLAVTHEAASADGIAKIQAALNRIVSHPEEKLDMRAAARMSCLSYSAFSRTFTQNIGCSYVDYCNMARVHRAEELLESTGMPVTEIAQALGFGSASYFNRVFLACTGCTPTAYRRGRGS